MPNKKTPINPLGKPGDYTYGILNSIDKPAVGRSIDGYGSDIWSMIAQVTGDAFKTDSLANSGPYRGVVLRIESSPEDITSAEVFNDPDDATHYIYSNSETGGEPPKLVRIKVRVPELHSHLRAPSAWGDTEGDHHLAIDMHPTYVAQTDAVPEPAVGDVVWVDYTNKNDFTDPIYLQPVTAKQHLIQLVAQVSGKNAFGNCTGTTGGTGYAGISDRVPAVNYSANQNYPKGTRKLSEGEATEVIEAGQSNGVMEPEKAIKGLLETMASKNEIIIKAWAGRLDGNGGRNVIVMMPKTTNLSNPFEIIYHFHGAKSWFSYNTPDHIFKNMKTLADDKRNFVLVYIQCPWSGEGVKYKTQQAGAGGSEKVVFLSPPFGKSKGGNIIKLHNQVLTVIKEVLKGSPADDQSPLALSFLTITCHSRGGLALAMLAATGQLMQLKPDKITLGDADYGWGGPPDNRRTGQVIFGKFTEKLTKKNLPEDFPRKLLLEKRSEDAEFGLMTPSLRTTDIVYQYYVSKAGKNVEYNLIVIAPSRRGDNANGDRGNFPRSAAQELIRTRLNEQVPTNAMTTFEPSNGGGTAYITYVPLAISHNEIGMQHAITFVGSDKSVPKASNKDKEVQPEERDSMPTSSEIDISTDDQFLTKEVSSEPLESSLDNPPEEENS